MHFRFLHITGNKVVSVTHKNMNVHEEYKCQTDVKTHRCNWTDDFLGVRQASAPSSEEFLKYVFYFSG